MSQINEIIHQSLRLKVMAALTANPEEKLEFKRLKAVTGATDGNLGRQITVLAEAGYIAIEKDHHANRSRTRATVTDLGLAAFEAYVAHITSLLSPPG